MSRNKNLSYKRFRIREIVYDFYIAGVGDKAEIEAMQEKHPEYWKDD